MNEINARLIKCFSAVFPQMPTADIPTSSTTVFEDWDSLASVTLVSVVEEEFAIQIDPEDIEHFVSYQAVLDYLTAKRPA
jgi:acyl carrier protein